MQCGPTGQTGQRAPSPAEAVLSLGHWVTRSKGLRGTGSLDRSWFTELGHSVRGSPDVLELDHWIVYSSWTRSLGHRRLMELGHWVSGSRCRWYGTQSRSRTCTPGRHGGRDCVGDATQTQACSEQPCPGTLHKSIPPYCVRITFASHKLLYYTIVNEQRD